MAEAAAYPDAAPAPLPTEVKEKMAPEEHELRVREAM
jgi:hypothetical protein